MRQIFVYGNSERPGLVAVIVPTPEAFGEFGDDIAGLKAALRESLQQTAAAAELQSYEVPVDFLIETEPFTDQNGLLSGLGKQLRPRLKEHYGERLEQMYTEIAAAQVDEMRELRETAADRPVMDTLARASRALLGTAGANPEAHFTDLGGDSLSALTFSNLLEEIFGVEGAGRSDHQPGQQHRKARRLHRDTAQRRRAASELHDRSRARRDRDFGQRINVGQVHRRPDIVERKVIAARHRRTQHCPADWRERLAGAVPDPGVAGATRRAGRQADHHRARARLRRGQGATGKGVRQRRSRTAEPVPRAGRRAPRGATRRYRRPGSGCGRRNLDATSRQRRSDRAPGRAGQPCAALRPAVRPECRWDH